MPYDKRKLNKQGKVFIDSSITSHRYFDKMKITLSRKYAEIITTKKEIKKLHKLLETVEKTNFSTISNIKWLLEQFSKDAKYKIVEKNKNIKFCIKNKLHVITANTKFSTKIKLKGGSVELLTDKLQNVSRKACVIDTCAFGAKDVEKILEGYKTIYVPSIVIRERKRLGNKKWPNFDLTPVFVKEDPSLIADDNILIFCLENNLDLITADKEMAAKAYTHGIKCRLLPPSDTHGHESNNIHQTGTIPKVSSIMPKVATPAPEKTDDNNDENRLHTNNHLISFGREKISKKGDALFFSSSAMFDEMVYVIRTTGEIMKKSTAAIKVEKGDIIKHFMQKSELNTIYCKISTVQTEGGKLRNMQSIAIRNSIEGINSNLHFSEQEKELIKEKYF